MNTWGMKVKSVCSILRICALERLNILWEVFRLCGRFLQWENHEVKIMMITPDPFGPAPEAPDSANICLDIHKTIQVSQSTRSVETQTAPQNRKGKTKMDWFASWWKRGYCVFIQSKRENFVDAMFRGGNRAIIRFYKPRRQIDRCGQVERCAWQHFWRPGKPELDANSMLPRWRPGLWYNRPHCHTQMFLDHQLLARGPCSAEWILGILRTGRIVVT